VKKKDGTLRLCVDYRGLNEVTIKNRHPLPLISESLDRLTHANVFTSLDLKEAYHRLRIKEGDEWKTAFRTRYGHFEYTVVPFGLTNAPAAFQAYINKALVGLVDVICIVYLDDILIFSNSEEEHIEHVKTVLERLREHKLYVNADKCSFHTTETEYLGYLITPDGVSIDPSRVKTILDWPEPASIHEIRVFIGFINYYRRFVHKFAEIAAPLNDLTKKGPEAAKKGHKLRQEESVALDIGKEGREAFQKLRDSFLEIPILGHYDPAQATVVETDASGRAICGILSQKEPEDRTKGSGRPVAFYSRKMTDTETRYDTHDGELLAIVESLRVWSRYLEGLKSPFTVVTDHSNLQYFMRTKTLSRRQARWAGELAEYHFSIEHRPGKLNPADGPSRRPDYMLGAADDVHRATSANLAYLQYQLALPSQKESFPAQVPLVAAVNLLGAPEGLETDAAEPLRRLCGLVLVMKEDERRKVLEQCHSSPLSGHFGERRTLEKVKRHFTWPNLRRDVKEFVGACLRCKKAKPVRHKPYGFLQPLPVPEGPWESLSMDFITDLPPSRFGNDVHDKILVIMDRFTKMAHYIPTRKDIKAYDLARIFMREIVRLHGVPKDVVSDRGPLMVSAYWRSFLHYLSTHAKFSTAFHPQTDGQTERQNQTLEQYLRIYCSFEQDDWATWINLAEFAYNDSVHAATGTSPFRAYTGRDPRRGEWPEKDHQSRVPHAQTLAGHIVEQQSILKAKLEWTRQQYAKRYDVGREQPVLEVGDQVLINSKNTKSARPKKKLDSKFLGPYTVTKALGPVVYQLNLPKHLGFHPVFHISLLEKYTGSQRFPQPKVAEWETLDLGDEDVHEIERILDQQRGPEGLWEYRIRWKGKTAAEDSWERAANISSAALRQFQASKANPKPKEAKAQEPEAPNVRTLMPPEPREAHGGDLPPPRPLAGIGASAEAQGAAAETPAKPKRGPGRPPKRKEPGHPAQDPITLKKSKRGPGRPSKRQREEREPAPSQTRPKEPTVHPYGLRRNLSKAPRHKRSLYQPERA
jgi:RNase H-like domain found in reverse transcriptase/Reverse transcriptase (RNA-dependent DNA polymerase)/Integrase zinc binding domain/Chromo (CHRromatin Organisation MOdifier) domain